MQRIWNQFGSILDQKTLAHPSNQFTCRCSTLETINRKMTQMIFTYNLANKSPKFDNLAIIEKVAPSLSFNLVLISPNRPKLRISQI